MRRKEFNSWLGFFNYHFFWTGLVMVKTISDSSKDKYKLQRIKKVFWHKDKSKIWINEEVETEVEG